MDHFFKAMADRLLMVPRSKLTNTSSPVLLIHQSMNQFILYQLRNRYELKIKGYILDILIVSLQVHKNIVLKAQICMYLLTQ